MLKHFVLMNVRTHIGIKRAIDIKKGYYHKYNKEHPERLERGYTKGYVDGKVSNGVKEKENSTIWYDELGRAHSRDFFNPTFSDMLDYKCYVEWHDDDWCED